MIKLAISIICEIGNNIRSVDTSLFMGLELILVYHIFSKYFSSNVRENWPKSRALATFLVVQRVGSIMTQPNSVDQSNDVYTDKTW